MNEETAVNILREVKNILDDCGIRYWLDYGGLLGAVRDGKFIPWDHDIDFSLLYPDAMKLLDAIPKFKKKGFFVKVHCNNITFFRDDIGVNIAAYQSGCSEYFHINYPAMTYFQDTIRVFYDFACYRHYPSMEARAAFALAYLFACFIPTRWLSRNISFLLWKVLNGLPFGYAVPKHFFDKLDTIKFYGMTFNIPSSVDDYLTFKYGNWRVPQRKWDISNDDGAIVKGKEFRKRFGRWYLLRDLIKGKVKL